MSGSENMAWSTVKSGKSAPPSSILQAAAKQTPPSGRSPHKGGQKQQQQSQRRKSKGNGKAKKGKQQQQHQQVNRSNSKVRLEDIVLLEPTGTGTTDQEKSVVRITLSKFLSCRMQYLQTPTSWTPHERCEWTSSDRTLQIEQEMKRLWDFKPLDINEETRFKPKVMMEESQLLDTEEEQLRQATAILNKLSWTTLDKLTLQFLETLAKDDDSTLSKEMVKASMGLIVDKAMQEPHFAELYARFSAKLTTVHKAFKKTLLAICQQQFEETDKEPELTTDDPVVREYILTQERRKSIGLMQFIGELYKLRLIKGAIMIGCLQRLLVVDDEEKLECFAKLMTTIGARLHAHEDEPEMHDLWEHVYSMAGRSKNNNADGPQAPSTRIKFLLQDLIELKESGWIQRRQVEKAKTIAQIHKEAAQEEAAAANKNRGRGKMTRSQSGGVAMPRTPSIPDREGFMQVGKPKKQSLRRAKSDVVPQVSSSLQRAAAAGDGASGSPAAVRNASITSLPIVETLDPKECNEKTKNILKEYFVGGDTADAVLSIEELVGMSHEGQVERGAAVIEGAVLLVMEMKETEVRKMLTVLSQCLGEGKIDKASVPLGLRDPLEFLRDIEIDAPLASSLLAIIVVEWLQLEVLTLDFLLTSPEYFRSDGRPADFCLQVLAKRGGSVSDAEVDVVTKLMSEEEKKAHPSVREWLESSMKS